MKLSLILFPAGLIGLISLAALVSSDCRAAACQQEKAPAQVENPPIACSLTAMTKAQRKRHTFLREQMQKGVQEVKELPDGYAFRFAADAKTIVNLAEFISLERLCCPFFQFELAVGGGNQPAWLRLTGGAGVKEFLKQWPLSSSQ
jgi:hypothetical protein